jgi:hypothetical protein
LKDVTPSWIVLIFHTPISSKTVTSYEYTHQIRSARSCAKRAAVAGP